MQSGRAGYQEYDPGTFTHEDITPPFLDDRLNAAGIDFVVAMRV